jgi:hypothetical protein
MRKTGAFLLAAAATVLAAHWTGNLPWPASQASAHTVASYAWSVTEPSGDPVTWSTCTIDFQINPAGAPDGALEDVLAAAERIQAASGITLNYLGTTDTAPAREWVTRAPLDGSRPVLVAWVDPESGLLNADNGGKTTLGHIGTPGQQHFMAGLIVFNATLDARRDPGFTHPRARGAVYQHEFAHLVGLGHVDDTDQLMYPHNGYRIDLGAGDLAGLAEIGARTCGR